VGHTDLGGNLDILASLRGTQRLLLDLVDSAQEVEALCARVTALWLEYYDRLDRIIRPRCGGTSCWTPLFSCGTTYMLQCDFSYMISPAMFERFVMPDLVACCNHLEHAFYHLDGRGEIPHLDMLLSIPRLRGVQWIPGDGQPTADRWPQLLARIRAGGKLCQIFVTPEGALRVVRTVGGRGFLFVVSGSPSEFPDREHVQAFLEELRSSDVSRGQRPRAGTA
jgi:5-methyltetrahydrofolate--homocysteine methyltransferase